MVELIGLSLGLLVLFIIVRYTLKGEKNLYYYIESPISEITPDYFIIYGKKINWNDIDFIHFSDRYGSNLIRTRYRFPLPSVYEEIPGYPSKPTILIFIKGKKFPYLLKLMRLKKTDVQNILNAVNQYNTRFDLWHNRFQRWIWE